MIDLLVQKLIQDCSQFALIELPTKLNPLERKEYPVATVYFKSDEKIADNYMANLYARQWIVLITANQSIIESALTDVIKSLSGYKPTGIVTPISYIGSKLETLNGALLQISAVFEANICFHLE